TVRGSLLEQAEKVPELLLTKYLKNWVYYDGMVRDERYPFPPDALRELVYNALVHARHAARIPVQIKVYDDRIYFSNIGGLPATWTTDTLFETHGSKPANPDIARAFYLAGYIESWGQGVSRVCEACEADGIDLPAYTANPDDIMVMLKTTESRAHGLEEGLSPNSEINQEISSEINLDKLILDLIGEFPAMTLPQAAAKLGVTPKQVEYRYQKLKESGKIARVGSRKAGHWVVLDEE
ncbi:ATP-binding protein, partial [Gordonibacter sp.]|uniref:ATP-binding protein n=1 Tax=Gordonibacter sp. TaxID=1968902 RepID=UPI002FCAEF29